MARDPRIPMFMFRYMPGFVSMRVFWQLIKIKDVTRHPPIFSDRYGGKRVHLWRDWRLIYA